MVGSIWFAQLTPDIIKGEDPSDSTSITPKRPPVKKDKFTVGVPREYYVSELSSHMLGVWKEGIARLKARGCKVVEMSLPNTQHALSAYYIIASAEASSNLARYDGVRYGFRSTEGETIKASYTHTRTEGFGEEVKRRIMLGTYVLSRKAYDSYYKKALEVRRLVSDDFSRAFEDIDAILTPTSPTPAQSISALLAYPDPSDVYMNDIMTVPSSLAGLPAISVPGSWVDELPVGLQLVGRQFDDDSLLNLARLLEMDDSPRYPRCLN